MHVAVTHRRIDLDAASCLWFLERERQVDRIVFWGGGEIGLAEATHLFPEEGDREVTFLDLKPAPEVVKKAPFAVKVYDHHGEPGGSTYQTALELLIPNCNTSDLPTEKLVAWQAAVQRADQKTLAVPDQFQHMDLQRLLKLCVPLVLKDDEHVYRKWFTPLLAGYFFGNADFEALKSLLEQEVTQFLLAGGDVSGGRRVKTWLQLKSETLARYSEAEPRLFPAYLASMPADKGKTWLGVTLSGIAEEQKQFQMAKREFGEAEAFVCGETLVMTQVTGNEQFSKAARNVVGAHVRSLQGQPLREKVPAAVRETITSDEDPWVLIQVNPGARHFQVFCNGGHPEAIAELFAEITKAVRAEVLRARGQGVPGPDRLSVEGHLVGTEPLYYYNKKERPQVLWGSLTRPELPPASVFGRNSYQVQRALIDIVRLAADPAYLPVECNPIMCESCPILRWWLTKCDRKRQSTDAPKLSERLATQDHVNREVPAQVSSREGRRDQPDLPPTTSR